MTATEPGRTRLRWHRRLEARVVGVLGLLVAGALGTMLTLTTDSVSSRSRERAATELEIVRTAFYSHLATRTSSAIAASQLITQLPVFRAHFTDSRLAADHLTIDAMADDYRRQLGAQFVIVTNAAGTWLASPGWPQTTAKIPEDVQGLVDGARDGASTGEVISRGDGLFLAVSSPARFADEVLGTLTIGYQITDAVAEELARVAHCEVIALVDGKIAASSANLRAQTGFSDTVTRVSSGGVGVHSGLYKVGDRQFVAGMFALEPGNLAKDSGRLVLMADWEPTKIFVDRLRTRIITFGVLAFGLTLAVGLVFSRSVSRPLRDIAAAATRIADGELALQLPVRGSDESITVAEAFNHMSTRLKATRDRLEHDAIHDGLTQLPNRVLFMERLERAMARLAKHPEDYRFAVLFLDLDRFKHVNDSLGHAVGDQLLIDFAGRLETAVRRTDVVVKADQYQVVEPEADTLARFGGDEFVILLDDLRESVDAVRVAERVLQETALAFQVGGHEVFTTVSVGVAVSSPVHRTGGDVVRDADAAMYRAKASGGGAYAVFDDTIHEAAVERLRLETELRRAVERDEFCLFYQPIVSLKEGAIVGFEALIRWRHPERGLLPPSTFLHAAEQNGVMAAIDEWALRQACGQIRRWMMAEPDREPPTVSVNLSSKAFGSSSIVRLVEEILQVTRVPAKYLRLEVTEGVAMADPTRARETLTDLRALGVRVSLDDFGTGYCSLSYLQQFPVDVLKIDRSFIQRMHEPEGAAIVKLIVALAHALDLELVAEGTEEHDQVEHLRELGCAFGQGYFFGRPVAADQVSFVSAMTISTRDGSWQRRTA